MWVALINQGNLAPMKKNISHYKKNNNHEVIVDISMYGMPPHTYTLSHHAGLTLTAVSSAGHTEVLSVTPSSYHKQGRNFKSLSTVGWEGKTRCPNFGQLLIIFFFFPLTFAVCNQISSRRMRFTSTLCLDFYLRWNPSPQVVVTEV